MFTSSLHLYKVITSNRVETLLSCINYGLSIKAALEWNCFLANLIVLPHLIKSWLLFSLTRQKWNAANNSKLQYDLVDWASVHCAHAVTVSWRYTVSGCTFHYYLGRALWLFQRYIFSCYCPGCWNPYCIWCFTLLTSFKADWEHPRFSSTLNNLKNTFDFFVFISIDYQHMYTFLFVLLSLKHIVFLLNLNGKTN